MTLKKALATLILTTALIASESVVAQSLTTPAQVSDEASSTRIEEVIVTAQKRTERLLDVPLSVTAASGEQLAKQGITDVAQLEKVAPGFSYQQSWLNAPILSIRGIGFFDNAVSASPTVTTYIDQVPLPYAAMARGAVFDVERVEILKGPQGTLFGQNSTGGAINFIAAKPTKNFNAGADLDAGRFETVNGQAFVSGPLTSGLTSRLALRYESRGDWQQGYPPNDAQFGKAGVDELGKRRFFNGRFLLDWAPSDRSSLQLSLNGWKDNSDTLAPRFFEFRPTAPPDPFNARAYQQFSGITRIPEDNRLAGWDAGRDFGRNDYLYQSSLRANVKLNDAMDLTSITAYTRYHENSLTEMDGTALIIGAANVRADIRSYYQELRLAAGVSRLNWMVGGNYARDEINEIQHYDLGGTNVHIGPFYWDGTEFRNQQNVDTLAGFGSLDYKLTDTLTAHGSGRYTAQRRSYAGCNADPGDGSLAAAFAIGFQIPATPGGCLTQSSLGVLPPIIRDHLDEGNVSWRTSLSWEPIPDAMLYGTVSKGYKAGSFSLLPAILAIQESPARQESVLAYETGIKLSAVDRRVQLSGAAFYYDYKNKQITGNVLILPFGALPKLQNIPRSRVYGAELEATLRPLQGLVVTAGVTYVNSRIQENPDTPTDSFGNPANFVGESFTNTPNRQGVADAQYTFPVRSNLQMFLGASATARSRTATALGNSNVPVYGITDFVIPGYALLDLRAGMQAADQSWRVQFWGRNVTDRFYRIGMYRQIDSVVDVAGMPATYGVTVAYRFH